MVLPSASSDPKVPILGSSSGLHCSPCLRGMFGLEGGTLTAYQVDYSTARTVWDKVTRCILRPLHTTVLLMLPSAVTTCSRYSCRKTREQMRPEAYMCCERQGFRTSFGPIIVFLTVFYANQPISDCRFGQSLYDCLFIQSL